MHAKRITIPKYNINTREVFYDLTTNIDSISDSAAFPQRRQRVLNIRKRLSRYNQELFPVVKNVYDILDRIYNSTNINEWLRLDEQLQDYESEIDIITFIIVNAKRFSRRCSEITDIVTPFINSVNSHLPEDHVFTKKVKCFSLQFNFLSEHYKQIYTIDQLGKYKVACDGILDIYRSLHEEYFTAYRTDPTILETKYDMGKIPSTLANRKYIIVPAVCRDSVPELYEFVQCKLSKNDYMNFDYLFD